MFRQTSRRPGDIMQDSGYLDRLRGQRPAARRLTCEVKLAGRRREHPHPPRIVVRRPQTPARAQSPRRRLGWRPSSTPTDGRSRGSGALRGGHALFDGPDELHSRMLCSAEFGEAQHRTRTDDPFLTMRCAGRARNPKSQAFQPISARFGDADAAGFGAIRLGLGSEMRLLPKRGAGCRAIVNGARGARLRPGHDDARGRGDGERARHLRAV